MTIRTLSLFDGPLLESCATADALARKAIEQEIWSTYGRELAILVLDMSGFSLLTQRHGIVHYLTMVRRMQNTVTPIITTNGGTAVKFQADDCFAVFDDPLPAVRAALDIHQALASDSHPDMIRVAIGIDVGPVLLVNDIDVFGNAVNRAAKLGEDVAQAGETLLTRESYDSIPASAGLAGRNLRVAISGIELEVVAL